MLTVDHRLLSCVSSLYTVEGRRPRGTLSRLFYFNLVLRAKEVQRAERPFYSCPPSSWAVPWFATLHLSLKDDRRQSSGTAKFLPHLRLSAGLQNFTVWVIQCLCPQTKQVPHPWGILDNQIPLLLEHSHKLWHHNVHVSFTNAKFTFFMQFNISSLC